jgi:hypothetical protein
MRMEYFPSSIENRHSRIASVTRLTSILRHYWKSKWALKRMQTVETLQLIAS